MNKNSETKLSGDALEIVNAAYAKLKSVKMQQKEAIAIVGMSCRFPQADNINSYWKLLIENKNAISMVSPEHWDISKYYNSEQIADNLISTPYAGCLKDIYDFDAGFFDISPKEALTLDPQQRLLLEVTVEALENANQPIDELSKVSTSVFSAISSFDYGVRLHQHEDEIDSFLGTGTLLSPAAGRISYSLNLNGPSMVIDTACSSSLVAIHQAITSLRNRESDISLVGGVGLLLEPNLSIAFSKSKMLSPDGKCKTFNATADGYVRGEGCAAVVLKRLSDATANNDNILAVVCGSAVNQDGASGGLTIPSGPAQEAVVKLALSNAGINPEEVEYIETHGTGTSLGDPIEVNALGSVFADRQSRLKVGSVKTNIGHLEAASGLASLIKVILSLQNQVIPASLHFTTPNPNISWQGLPIDVVSKNISWAKEGKQRVAGISAFGFSGTNAHIVISESESPPIPSKIEQSPPAYLNHILTISAKNKASLHNYIKDFSGYLESGNELNNICFTSNIGRAHYTERFSVVASDIEELQKKLALYNAETEKSSPKIEDVFTSPKGLQDSKIAFAFSGEEGEHNLSVIYKHLKNHTYFCKILDECKKIVIEHHYIIEKDWELMCSRDCQTVRTEDTHLLKFCIEYALAKFLGYIGAPPKIVFGYGLGDYIAACVAGILSLGDALLLVHARAKLLNKYSSNTDLGLNEFESIVQKVNLRKARIQFVGSISSKHKPNTASYWTAHFIAPIQPKPLLDNIQHQDDSLVLVASKPDLQKHFVTKDFLSIVDKETCTLSWIIACVYSRGGNIHWNRYHENNNASKVLLPTYSWNRETYMFSNKTNIIKSNEDLDTKYSLVQKIITSPVIQDKNMVFESHVSLSDFPYIKHHRIFNEVVFPESAYIEMLFETGSIINADFSHEHSFIIKNVVLNQPCVFTNNQHSVTLQIVLTQITDTTYEVKILSRNDKTNEWISHVDASIFFAKKHVLSQPEQIDLTQLKNNCTKALDIDSYYQDFAKTGVEYGTSFRTIKQANIASINDDSALGMIEIAESDIINTDKTYCIYPQIIDGCLQLISSILGADNTSDSTYFIMQIKSIQYYSPINGRLWCYVKRLPGLASDNFPVFSLSLLDSDGVLVAKVDDLQVNRAGKDVFLATQTHNWFYNIAWKKSGDYSVNISEVKSSLAQSQGDGVWLILSDRGNIGTQIKQFFDQDGEKYVSIKSGKGFSIESLNEYQVSPSSLEDFNKLFSVLIENNQELKIKGIIYLWGIDTHLDSSVMDTALDLSTGLLHLLQTLVRLRVHQAPISRLCVITNNAQPIDNSAFEPQQSVLWGMGRVIKLEHPEFKPLFIDYDQESYNLAEIILSEILSTQGESQVAFRKNQRYISRLQYNNTISREKSITIDANASYLITGGFGALGLQVAKRFVELGARNLILVGRRGAATDDAKKAVITFKSQKVTIQELALDISQPVDISDFLDMDAPLRGIVHTAGVLDDGLLLDKTTSSFYKVIAPKVQGILNLHNLTKNMSIDFFACFSSMTSVIGAVGQANYAAANTFMDMFCHYRASWGLPATSVSWGPWSGAGMGDNKELRRRWKSMGMSSISVEQGMDVLLRLLNTTGHIGVMPTDWSKYPDPDHFFDNLRLDAPTEKNEGDLILEKLKNGDKVQQKKLLRKYLESEICKILGYTEGKSFEDNQGFFELGMNSLTSVEFKNKLQKGLECQLSSTLTFDYPTINKLVEYLYEEILENDESKGSETEALADEVGIESMEDIVEKLLQQLDT